MNEKYVEMLKKADSGDTSAQLGIAMAYIKGEVNGYPESGIALSYMKKAAESGDDEIQNIYAGMLEHLGLETESYKWYKKSALSGNLESQIKLAQFYMIGEVCPKDNKEAFYWADKAFKGGEYKQAPMILATLRLQQEDLQEQDYIYVYKLFKIAEMSGNESATHFRTEMERLAPELKKL